MSKFVKGTLLILLGLVMLTWFAYSVYYPPQRPSETYAMDWIMIPIKLVGAVSALIGGLLTFVSKGTAAKG